MISGLCKDGVNPVDYIYSLLIFTVSFSIAALSDLSPEMKTLRKFTTIAMPQPPKGNINYRKPLSVTNFHMSINKNIHNDVYVKKDIESSLCLNSLLGQFIDLLFRHTWDLLSTNNRYSLVPP